MANPTPKVALERIVAQLNGIAYDDLSRAERNIVRLAASGLGQRVDTFTCNHWRIVSGTKHEAGLVIPHPIPCPACTVKI